ncbi:Uncharacterized protein TPAR_03410 [Tolypocladium paradoxum]|uniref:Centrosomin N-terminal motif 1 domain-containing protein n=1 Tax=Tolypocladium paradoxum TaxID=94208 RepID=A0A2S4L1S6_9HYPO|nr:Uncharacterized protein TPAR_03410 [Tolypocladium paradoxum]
MGHPLRQDTPESTRQPALSTFLLERLQKERRAEGDKTAYSASLSRTDMSASVDLGRAVQNSPFKPPESDGGRPRSSAGMEPAKRKGLGVKEMEQVVSTLHKQNFDLKLELFHRRERQTVLEESLEALETDKRQMEDVNDRLIEELEKRDKAVEEAVAMIVMLEAKIDQLVQERTMVQAVESEGFFCPRDYDMGYRNPAPQAPGPDIAKLEDDAKAVVRMPSFLSERSENTENLRNVYLGVKGSVLSLPRVAEGSPGPDNLPGQGLGSPTLSVLSESSFVSVYGQKGQGEGVEPVPPTHVDEQFALDGFDGGFIRKAGQEDTVMPRRRAASVSRAAGVPKPPPRSSTAVPFQSLSGIIGYGSPLQRLERLERFDGACANRKEATRPQSQGRDVERSQLVSPNKPSPPRRTKEEKREALRRVMTDAPGGVRLHDQGFPPTPDTISTSTLHRFKNSHETLSQEQEAANEQGGHGALLHSGGYEPKSSEHASGVPLGGQRPRTNASGKARDVSGSTSSDFRQSSAQRPRSAGDSTASHKRGNGWESDADDSDARSLESSLDIWLRESSKPAKSGGRVSPDLFSFPTNAVKGCWAMESMIGPNSGQTGGANIAPSYDYMQDLFAIRHQLFPAGSGSGSGPPPPNRRSSLHARTGSTSEASPTAADNPPADEGFKNPPRSRTRHAKKNSDDLHSRDDMRTPVQQQSRPPPPQDGSDQKRYPPITGHQGARAGLNRLFRRSIGSGSSNAAVESTQPSAAETAGADSSKNHPPMGVPSWVLRNHAINDERTGATPPPITLKPRRGRRNTLDADRPASPMATTAEPTKVPSTPHDAANGSAPPGQQEETGPSTGSGTGSRRKWLPTFGRSNSLKNKSG